jgi:hypothetical protein
MSYTIDAGTKLHDHQVAAVSAFQSLFVKTVKTVSGLTESVPKAPAKLIDTLDGVTTPLVKLIGTPSEVQAYAVASSRDWLEVQHAFRTALLDAVSPSVNDDAPGETS